jgi:hypothetical protein
MVGGDARRCRRCVGGELAGLPFRADSPQMALPPSGSVANAPFTGVLLVMETTGVFSLALPMIIAVVGTVIVDRILRKPTLTHGLELASRGPWPSSKPSSG